MSCVPYIDVMDDEDGRSSSESHAVDWWTVPRSPDQLGSGNGTQDSAKASATVCFSVDSVKKVPAKGTSGKDMDVGYDPLVRSVDPGVQESDYKYEGIGAPVETIEVGGHELRQGLPILSIIESKCTDPLIRSIQPDEQVSNLKSGGIRASPAVSQKKKASKAIFLASKSYFLIFG